MIKKSFFLLGCICTLLCLECSKDPTEATLPSSVELGKSETYLNGVKVDYTPIFKNVKIYRHINYGFAQGEIGSNKVNSLGFSWIPMNEGDFPLIVSSSDIPPGKNAFTIFNQTVSEDLRGYEYKLEKPEEGFFKVETLDTVKMEVSGRFKARFCRTAKNGTKGDLPKIILFQGVFNEKYTVL
jgi:hypothetical protein